MSVPTRLPDGVNIAAPNWAMNSYPFPDPTRWYQNWDDFSGFVAANWTVTETQAGATQALIDGDGGLLALVNSAANNDINQIQSVKEPIKLASTLRTIFKARFKVSDATASALYVGLQITGTNPATATDGLFFTKAAAATALTLSIVKNSTTTSVAAGTMADDTFVEVAWVLDPLRALIEVYFNNVRVGSGALTNLCDDEELAVTFAVVNGAAAAKTLTVDYYVLGKDRTQQQPFQSA